MRKPIQKTDTFRIINQIFSRSYNEGLNLLFQLLKYLLAYNDNLLLEENGCYIILKKEGNKYVSDILCDHKPEYPFDE